MNRWTLFETCTWKRSYGYLAENTAQISRQRASVRFVRRFQEPWASALRLMNNPG